VLYGLNLAKKTKRPNIILCEGNLDIVTLHQAGFDNAVASMGTALTVRSRLRLLSRYTKELVLCYDNDNAGQASPPERALETAEQLRVHRAGASAAPPPDWRTGSYIKQDADDFIKFQGRGRF
jgi:DNA primase